MLVLPNQNHRQGHTDRPRATAKHQRQKNTRRMGSHRLQTPRSAMLRRLQHHPRNMHRMAPRRPPRALPRQNRAQPSNTASENTRRLLDATLTRPKTTTSRTTRPQMETSRRRVQATRNRPRANLAQCVRRPGRPQSRRRHPTGIGAEGSRPQTITASSAPRCSAESSPGEQGPSTAATKICAPSASATNSGSPTAGQVRATRRRFTEHPA